MTGGVAPRGRCSSLPRSKWGGAGGKKREKNAVFSKKHTGCICQVETVAPCANAELSGQSRQQQQQQRHQRL